MPYELKYHKNIVDDLQSLDKSILDKVFKKLEQLKKNPNLGQPLGNKAIAKNKYTQMAQDFCLSTRRKNGRIASYATIFATQETDKKTSHLGIFFAGNRLRPEWI